MRRMNLPHVQLVYRLDIREAMKWLRRKRPGRHFRAIRHGFYGHVVWTTTGEAGVFCSMERLLDAYKRGETFRLPP